MIEPAELTSELFNIPFIGQLMAKIQPAITSFSAGAFRQQPALSDNPEGTKVSIRLVFLDCIPCSREQ